MENTNRVILSEQPACTEVRVEENVSCDTTGAVAINVEVEEFDISTFGRGLRRPEDGIRCAGRKGTTRLLWLHEYFVVNEGTTRKPKLSMFQALQILLGTDVPEGSVETMTEVTRREIWVLGVRHVPADEVRHCSTRNAGYLFHTVLIDGDAHSDGVVRQIS
jgi:hypothetical protein